MSSGFVEPVLVFTMARSKSSWVTAVVVDTIGAWVGTSTGEQKGYPRGQLENRRVIDLQRRWLGRAWKEAEKGREIQPRVGFREAVISAITRDGYSGGPWVYKCSALYWRAFVDAFPEARLVAVRRSVEGIYASAHRHKAPIPSDQIIQAHWMALDRLVDMGAFEVNPADDPQDIERLKSWLVQ